MSATLFPGTEIEIAHDIYVDGKGRWGFAAECPHKHHQHRTVYAKRHFPGLQVTYTDDPLGTGREWAAPDDMWRLV